MSETSKTIVEEFQDNMARLDLGELAPESSVVMFSFPCKACGTRCVSVRKAGDQPPTICERCGARYEVLVQIAYDRIGA